MLASNGYVHPTGKGRLHLFLSACLEVIRNAYRFSPLLRGWKGTEIPKRRMTVSRAPSFEYLKLCIWSFRQSERHYLMVKPIAS